MNNLHAALKTSIFQEVSEGGIHYKYVQLQHSKDHFIHTLHARPSEFTTAGLQTTDLLRFVGFQRSPCAFHGGECYARELAQSQDITRLAQVIGKAFRDLKEGARHLEHCGIYLDQPEGWGYFVGKPSSGSRMPASQARGDGHVATKSERMKESEDTIFRFVFTWIDGAGDKGWTTHYRAKHMPPSSEFAAVLNFLGGFSAFPSCPEFGFESCWWRFTPYEADANSPWGRNTEQAHNSFDAHVTHFAPGVEKVFTAHAALQQCGLSFLVISDPVATQGAPPSRSPRKMTSSRRKRNSDRQFDVFLCHNSADKPAVREIGQKLKEQGILPWLDEWNLRPGLPWQRALEEQIGQIKSAAVFVGCNGLGPWQHEELEAFLREFVSRQCPVIPVILPNAPQQPALPVFLRGRTWVDFRQKEPDPLQRLIWGITGNPT